jgi:hypothetical protein
MLRLGVLARFFLICSGNKRVQKTPKTNMDGLFDEIFNKDNDG